MLFNRSFLLLKSLFAMIFIVLSLSACSFSPIYSDNNIVNEDISLSYAKPTTKLEQIIYQDLKLRLGEAVGENANHLVIKISQSTRGVGRSSDGLPTNISEVKLSGTISIYNNSNKESIIFSATRVATASYATSSQSLANQQALTNASEVAALELAQIIRLTILSELNKPAN